MDVSRTSSNRTKTIDSIHITNTPCMNVQWTATTTDILESIQKDTKICHIAALFNLALIIMLIIMLIMLELMQQADLVSFFHSLFVCFASHNLSIVDSWLDILDPVFCFFTFAICNMMMLCLTIEWMVDGSYDYYPAWFVVCILLSSSSLLWWTETAAKLFHYNISCFIASHSHWL